MTENTCRLCEHTWQPRTVTIKCPKCGKLNWDKPSKGRGLARTIMLTGKGTRTADRTQAKADVRRARLAQRGQ